MAHLKCNRSEEVALNGIEVAALLCQHPLFESVLRLKKLQAWKQTRRRKREAGSDEVLGEKTEVGVLYGGAGG